MKIIKFIHNTFAQAFYGWAHKEIDVMHPDLIKIMMKRIELQEQNKEMFR